MRTPFLRLLSASLASSVVLVGCAAPGWDGRVETWGEMRPVMREGQTEGRVRLSEVVRRSHAYGVGAVEGLDGEILIDDGRCWVARGRSSASLDVIPDATTTNATLLIVAYVPEWTTISIDRALPAESLDRFVRDAAERAGLETAQPFPFVIEGEFRDVAAHVVNGHCPLDGSPETADAEPFRVNEKAIRGTLIGFYARDSAGRLTHHGTESHIHLLNRSPQVLVAHVETVGVAQGAVLRLPKR
ncbi:MAG: acetolactate decarboxylase [Planctomycetia bacterium]|nr:MAG: acetolactate decarboxylase [Planctomycetia bacterium]